jgi:hypothetical protein
MCFEGGLLFDFSKFGAGVSTDIVALIGMQQGSACQDRSDPRKDNDSGSDKQSPPRKAPNPCNRIRRAARPAKINLESGFGGILARECS